MPVVRGSELFRCLYIDEDGDLDLFGVQLFDPVPADRLPVLHAALFDPDPYVVFQVTQVLAAWADPAGLDSLERYVDNADTVGFEPDRITGQDNSLDLLAAALQLSRINGHPINEIHRVFRKLLRLYPDHFFKSHFAAALEKLADASLLDALIDAVNATLPSNPYQASRLVPAIAKIDAVQGWTQAQRFFGLDTEGLNPLYDIAIALGYVDTELSRATLQDLAGHDNTYLAELATKSLAKLATT